MKYKTKKYQTGGPIDATNVRSFGKEKLRAVQIDLKTKGFYKGEIDGVYGPKTELAIKGYNRVNSGYKLPEITIVSTNDASKVETLGILEQAQQAKNPSSFNKKYEERFGSNNYYNSWQLSGRPTITLTDPSDLIQANNYLPNRNKVRLNPAQGSISKANKVEDNDPGHGYQAISELVVNEELAHAYQKNILKQNLSRRAVKDFILNVGKDVYSIPGTMEYEAHSLLAPKLQEKANSMPYVGIDVIRHYPKPKTAKIKVDSANESYPAFSTGGQLNMKKKYTTGGDIGSVLTSVAPMLSMIPGYGTIAGMGAGLLGGVLSAGNPKDIPQNKFANSYALGGPVDPLNPFPQDSIPSRFPIQTKNGVPDLTGWTDEQMATYQINLLAQKNKLYKDAAGIVSNKTKSKLERYPREHASGGDIKLSSNAFLVKGNPNTTDGNSYSGGSIKLDDGEVIVNNFAISNDLTNPLTGNKFAKDALPIQKAIGKAEKRLVTSRDPIDANTIKRNNESMDAIKYIQELVATSKGLRNSDGSTKQFATGGGILSTLTDFFSKQQAMATTPFYVGTGTQFATAQGLSPDFYKERNVGLGMQANGNQGFATGGTIPEGVDPLAFQKWLNSQPGATKIAEDGKWGPQTERAFKAVGQQFLSSTGQNMIPDQMGSRSAINFQNNKVSSIETNRDPVTGMVTSVVPKVNQFIAPATPEDLAQQQEQYIATYPGMQELNDITNPGSITNSDGSIQRDPNAGREVRSRGEGWINYGPVDPAIAQRDMDQRANDIGFRQQEQSYGALPTNNPMGSEIGAKSPQDSPYRVPFTTGDALQAFEVGAKVFNAFQPVEKEPTRLNTTPITKESYDPSNQLYQSQRTYQNAINSIGGSPNIRRAVGNQLYASKLAGDANTITQYGQMNNQARTNYETRLAQRRQGNIASQAYSADVNSRNRGARFGLQDNAFTSLGNFGQVLNQKRQAGDAINIYQTLFPGGKSVTNALSQEDFLKMIYGK